MKIQYKAEFTQSQKVADEVYNKGIFTNLNVVIKNTLQEAINFFVELQNANIPVLFNQFWLEIYDDNNKLIHEEIVNGVPHTKDDHKLIDKNKQLQAVIDNNIEYINADTKYKDEFKKYINSKN